MLLLNRQRLMLIIIALFLVSVSGCASISPISTISKSRTNSDYDVQEVKAFVLMDEGHMKAAVPVLKQLADDYPNRVEPHVNMSIAYRQLGLVEQSIDAIENAIAIDPRSSTAAHQHAILYREQGEFQASQEAYEQAIQVNPNYALAHRNLGILFDLYLQNPEVALHHYEQYLSLSKDMGKEVTFWIADIKRRLSATEKRVSR